MSQQQQHGTVRNRQHGHASVSHEQPLVTTRYRGDDDESDAGDSMRRRRRRDVFAVATLVIVSIAAAIALASLLAVVIIHAGDDDDGGGGGSGGSAACAGGPLAELTAAYTQADRHGRSDHVNETELLSFCALSRPMRDSACADETGAEPCYVRLARVTTSRTSAAVSLVKGGPSDGTIAFDARDYYVLRLCAVTTAHKPLRHATLSLVDVTAPQGASRERARWRVGGGGSPPECVDYEGIVEAGTRLAIRFLRDPSSSSEASADDDGRISILASVARDVRYAQLQELTKRDLALKVRWIPERPAFLPNPPFAEQWPHAGAKFPWFSPVIPAAPVPGDYSAGATALPSGDGYAKFPSLPASINFYMGAGDQESPADVSPEDDRLSVFVTNLENRGPRSLRKRVYMSALTADRMPFYAAKIDAFLNEVRAAITTYERPVLGAFRDALVRFFLRIHIGEDDYPPEVVAYFDDFIDMVGLGDPLRPGRDEAVMRGARRAARVRAYFAERVHALTAARDEASIVYHWFLAGLSPRGLVQEAIHNIVALSQFNHVFYLAIQDGLRGTERAPGSNDRVAYRFFAAYAAAQTDAARLDVVRELYRLTVPNGNSFSRVVEREPATGAPVAIQARHLHKGLMMTAAAVASGTGSPSGHFAYGTGRYGAFSTDFAAGASGCPYAAAAQRSEAARKSLAGGFSAEPMFDVSPVDNETLVERCNPKLTPVFAVPLYAPFGLGHRRCAGETMANFIAGRMLAVFGDLVFYEKPPLAPAAPLPPGMRRITLAPYTAVPDNIYVARAA